MSHKLTQEEFVNRSIEVQMTSYDYSNAKYNGRMEPVEITCTKHAITFWQPAGLHMSGQTSCSECFIEKKRASRKAKRIAVAPEGYHYCKTCSSVLGNDNFNLNPFGADGLNSVCKACVAERSLVYRTIPENITAIKERNRIYTKRVRHKWNEKTARRRAARIRATRQTFDKEFEDLFISEIYHLAAIRSDITGEQWEVDHVVPLTSNLVCGFHVWYNLQVIPAFDNRSKGNRYWPDMW